MLQFSLDLLVISASGLYKKTLLEELKFTTRCIRKVRHS